MIRRLSSALGLPVDVPIQPCPRREPGAAWPALPPRASGFPMRCGSPPRGAVRLRADRPFFGRQRKSPPGMAAAGFWVRPGL